MPDAPALPLAQRLYAVQQQLGNAAMAAGRAPDAVQLLAVSKTRSADDIAALAALGVRDFGENYLQEALAKQAQLADLPLTWHFIGPIQSNKTRDIARRFHWVHSVDRLRIAERLSEQRGAEQPPLNICLQVNVDREASKSGVTPEQLPALAQQVAALPHLRLRGLMALPSADSNDRNRAAFATLARLQQQLGATLPGLDTLSMGMSDDFDTAIAEGATFVRIGTALFGPRPARP
ncbi:YggS family pyridoxal phosphate-dependent enzyme [Isoalcanivorax beigongshangi]|uniref:Pyridoxal phosphate homeostasis protein n=1 Tax=Isoalcanivorax beigongshangi TaxID=3238810 RepID=A0ABV4AGD3_9GAMM